MGNFIYEDLAASLWLISTPCNLIPLLDVKGLLTIGELAFQVTTTLCIGIHEEQIVLDVAPIGSHSPMLGLPWLQLSQSYHI